MSHHKKRFGWCEQLFCSLWFFPFVLFALKQKMIPTVCFCICQTGGLFPTGSHEYEVFRFALAQHQDVPKLVPQVDMVDTGSSFAMTYACKSRNKEVCVSDLNFLNFSFKCQWHKKLIFFITDPHAHMCQGCVPSNGSGMSEFGGVIEPKYSVTFLDLAHIFISVLNQITNEKVLVIVLMSNCLALLGLWFDKCLRVSCFMANS